MRLTQIKAGGFRNLDGTIDLPESLPLIAGENNTGKSNVIDALRVLTHPYAGARFGRWITSDDFAHDGQGHPLTDTFELEALYVGLTAEQQGRFATCLAPCRATCRSRCGAMS
jgi:putative ATP-dependent endonuclease of OLD family